MTDRELMQQALDALEAWDARGRLRIIEALRKRLAQCDRCGKVNPAEIHTCTPKKQEPGAVDSDKVICPSCCQQFRAIPVNVQQLMLAAGFEPPFTSPQPRESGCAECGKKASDGWALYCVECSAPMREWVGLTKEEVEEWELPVSPTVYEFAQFIEAKLKEKNT